MGNKLKSLMDTLKVDGTNPLINKETLMKVMKAVEEDAPAKYVTDATVTNLPSSFVDKLELGDVVNTPTASYFVIRTNSAITRKYLATINDDSVFIAEYILSEGAWSLGDSYPVYFLPHAAAEDEGNMVVAADDGSYELVEPPAGGTKLYKHEITGLSSMGGSVQADLYLTFYSTQDTKVTNMGMLSILNNAISIKTKVMAQGSTLMSLFKDFVVGPNTLSIYMFEGSGAFGVGPHNFSGTPSDTVTPL